MSGMHRSLPAVCLALVIHPPCGQAQQPRAMLVRFLRDELQWPIDSSADFEDLSFAFNRMIRNLLTKQEELNENKQVLDRKVDELAQANS